MLLDATTRKLQLVLTAAMTTANMPVSVYYVDSSASALPVSGIAPTNSNGVTYVDILAAPAASTQRKVNALTVNNTDTAAKTVQIYLDDNGTDYLQCAATLQVGDVLGYTDTRGWYVNDSAGNLKMASANAQPLDATLTSIATLGTAADKLIYSTGVDTWAETSLTAFARSILDDANEATFKATVNLEIGTDVQAYDATLASIAALGTAANKIAYTTGIDTWAETALTAAAITVLDDATVGDMVNTLGGATSTGTGGLVRTTNAALVTPALGTPASGDLRNCSLAVAPAIGGTTPAAGAFTTLSASQAGDNLLYVESTTASPWRGIAMGMTTDANEYASSKFEAVNGEYRHSSGYGGWGGFQTFYTGGAIRMYVDSIGLSVTGTISATSTILSSGATNGVGYTTGAGGTVTQITSRTTGVTINKINGAITLVSAVGSASWQSFTVTNSAVAATDKVIVSQKSGTDLNQIQVTNIAAGSFQISFATTGGTTTEQPVFGFSIIKGVEA